MDSANTEEVKRKLSASNNTSVSSHFKYANEAGEPLLYKSKKPEINKSFGVLQNTSVRAVSKNGECNICPLKLEKKHFMRDVFTTLVDIKWRYTLSFFSLGFIITWTFFAILWWIVVYHHGDLEEKHLPMYQRSGNWTPCVRDIYGFHSCFMFSVETQQTTGYGEKRTTEECFHAVALMSIQNVVGLMVDAFLIGVFFAKLIRPKYRGQTIRFSKHALISMRDNALCLIFRIGDMKAKSRIIEAKLKAQMITQRKSAEGEIFSHYLTKLPVSIDDCENDIFFIWPLTVVHKINQSSPLFDISKRDLMEQNFEIVVRLEGTIESTDQKLQVRSSYLASEILWGYRLEPVITRSGNKFVYRVDYSKFDDVVKDDTPACSAAEMDYNLNSGLDKSVSP